MFSKDRSPTLKRGGEAVHCWRPQRGGLEQGGVCSAGSGGARMGRTAELGRGLSERWASWESGEDLDVVGELQMLRGIRVQSDDGVVIISGFFLPWIAVE